VVRPLSVESPEVEGLIHPGTLGEVGAIFGLKMSRLPRSSADLSRLLQLARLTATVGGRHFSRRTCRCSRDLR
jgi:hypothetical protein